MLDSVRWIAPHLTSRDSSLILGDGSTKSSLTMDRFAPALNILGQVRLQEGVQEQAFIPRLNTWLELAGAWEAASGHVSEAGKNLKDRARRTLGEPFWGGMTSVLNTISENQIVQFGAQLGQSLSRNLIQVFKVRPSETLSSVFFGISKDVLGKTPTNRRDAQNATQKRRQFQRSMKARIQSFHDTLLAGHITNNEVPEEVTAAFDFHVQSARQQLETTFMGELYQWCKGKDPDPGVGWSAVYGRREGDGVFYAAGAQTERDNALLEKVVRQKSRENNSPREWPESDAGEGRVWADFRRNERVVSGVGALLSAWYQRDINCVGLRPVKTARRACGGGAGRPAPPDDPMGEDLSEEVLLLEFGSTRVAVDVPRGRFTKAGFTAALLSQVRRCRVVQILEKQLSTYTDFLQRMGKVWWTHDPMLLFWDDSSDAAWDDFLADVERRWENPEHCTLLNSEEISAANVDQVWHQYCAEVEEDEELVLQRYSSQEENTPNLSDATETRSWRWYDLFTQTNDHRMLFPVSVVGSTPHGLYWDVGVISHLYELQRCRWAWFESLSVAAKQGISKVWSEVGSPWKERSIDERETLCELTMLSWAQKHNTSDGMKNTLVRKWYSGLFQASDGATSSTGATFREKQSGVDIATRAHRHLWDYDKLSWDL